jgi:hypothetical protein
VEHVRLYSHYTCRQRCTLRIPLADILNGFRSALAPGPWKIVVVAIVGSLILLLVAGYLIQSAREKRRRRMLADRLYEHRAAEVGLAPEDRRLLDSLAARLDRPQEQKHHLLADPGLFHKAAVRALDEGVASKEAVAALRKALGLAHPDAAGFLRSSTEIGEGAAIRLEPEGGQPLYARVIATAPRALVVEAEPAAGHLPAVGSRLGATLTTEAGSFRFASEVLERSERILSLAHSERVEHEQARRFYRKGVETPAAVWDAKTGEDLPVRLLDLSGGGASLEITPRGPAVELGQTLELRLDLPRGKPLTVAARVVRLSGGGSRAHLEFQGLSLRSQDRIVEYVLR